MEQLPPASAAAAAVMLPGLPAGAELPAAALVYAERCNAWLLGLPGGLAVFTVPPGAAPSAAPTYCTQSAVHAPSVWPPAAPALDDFSQIIATAATALHDPQQAAASAAGRGMPPLASRLHELSAASLVQPVVLPQCSAVLVQDDHSLRLLASTPQGTVPIDNILPRDMDPDGDPQAPYIFDFSLADFEILLTGLDWTSMLRRFPVNEQLAIVRFFQSAVVQQATSAAWQRVLVVLPVAEAIRFHFALRRYLQTTPLPSDYTGDTLSQVVRVIAAAEHQLRARCLSDVPLARDPHSSALYRLQTLSAWTVSWPSAAQLAEAGFAYDADLQRVRHFAALNDTQATFDVSTAKGQRRLRQYINERCHRGCGPPGAAWNVPLSAAINAQAASASPGDLLDLTDMGDTTPNQSVLTSKATLGGAHLSDSAASPGGQIPCAPLLASLTTAGRNGGLIFSCSEDGAATIWTVEPSLFALVTFNLRQPTGPSLTEHQQHKDLDEAPGLSQASSSSASFSPGPLLSFEQGQELAEGGRLVHLGLLADGPLLAPLLFTALFSDDDLGCSLRLLSTESLLAVWVRESRTADGLLHTPFEHSDHGEGAGTLQLDPAQRYLVTMAEASASLEKTLAGVSLFPDHLRLQDPGLVADFAVPLAYAIRAVLVTTPPSTAARHPGHNSSASTTGARSYYCVLGGVEDRGAPQTPQQPTLRLVIADVSAWDSAAGHMDGGLAAMARHISRSPLQWRTVEIPVPTSASSWQTHLVVASLTATNDTLLVVFDSADCLVAVPLSSLAPIVLPLPSPIAKPPSPTSVPSTTASSGLASSATNTSVSMWLQHAGQARSEGPSHRFPTATASMVDQVDGMNNQRGADAASDILSADGRPSSNAESPSSADADSNALPLTLLAAAFDHHHRTLGMVTNNGCFVTVDVAELLSTQALAMSRGSSFFSSASGTPFNTPLAIMQQLSRLLRGRCLTIDVADTSHPCSITTLLEEERQDLRLQVLPETTQPSARTIEPAADAILDSAAVTGVDLAFDRPRAFVMVNRKHVLRVRSAPAASAPVIGSFTEGSIVKALGRKGDWLRLELLPSFRYPPPERLNPTEAWARQFAVDEVGFEHVMLREVDGDPESAAVGRQLQASWWTPTADLDLAQTWAQACREPVQETFAAVFTWPQPAVLLELRLELLVSHIAFEQILRTDGCAILQLQFDQGPQKAPTQLFVDLLRDCQRVPQSHSQLMLALRINPAELDVDVPACRLALGLASNGAKLGRPLGVRLNIIAADDGLLDILPYFESEGLLRSSGLEAPASPYGMTQSAALGRLNATFLRRATGQAVAVLSTRNAERDLPLRSAAIEFLQLLVQRFEQGLAIFSQVVDFDTLLLDGLVHCTVDGPSDVYALLSTLISAHDALKLPILHATTKLLPHLRLHVVSPVRLHEFLALFFAAAVIQPIVAVEAVRNELLSLGRVLTSASDRQLYAKLRSRYGLGGLPLEEGCFDLQGLLGAGAVQLRHIGLNHSAPLPLRLVSATGSANAAGRDQPGSSRYSAAHGDPAFSSSTHAQRLAAPPVASLRAPSPDDGLCYRRHHLLCRGYRGHAILEFPGPAWLTSLSLVSESNFFTVKVAVIPLDDGGQGGLWPEALPGQALVQHLLQPVSDENPNLWQDQAGAMTSDPTRAAQPSSAHEASDSLHLRCMRVAVYWQVQSPARGADDEAVHVDAAPLPQLFQTPPDRVGRVQISTRADGSTTVTPMRHTASAGAALHLMGTVERQRNVMGDQPQMASQYAGEPAAQDQPLSAAPVSSRTWLDSSIQAVPPPSFQREEDVLISLQLAFFGHLLFDEQLIGHAIKEDDVAEAHSAKAAEEQVQVARQQRRQAASTSVARAPNALHQGSEAANARVPMEERGAGRTSQVASPSVPTMATSHVRKYLPARRLLSVLQTQDRTILTDLSQRQYVLREIFASTDTSFDGPAWLGGNSASIIEAAHSACCEKQVEAVCARWTLRQFVLNHPQLGLAPPALPRCDVDRALATAEALIAHYLTFAKQDAVAARSIIVRDISDARTLYTAFCHQQLPALSDAVFELLQRTSALDQHAWAQFIIQALETRFGGEPLPGGGDESVFRSSFGSTRMAGRADGQVIGSSLRLGDSAAGIAHESDQGSGRAADRHEGVANAGVANVGGASVTEARRLSTMAHTNANGTSTGVASAGSAYATHNPASASKSNGFAAHSSFFDPLRAIAQRHHLTQPSMYNPLLQAVLEYAGRAQNDIVVLEASLFLLASSLPALAVAAATALSNAANAGPGTNREGLLNGQATGGLIVIYVVDANRCRTLFRIRRTTPLQKMFQAFCEMKDVRRRECEFLYQGQPLDGDKSAVQLGLNHEDTVHVVWRPSQADRPRAALSRQQQLVKLRDSSPPSASVAQALARLSDKPMATENVAQASLTGATALDMTVGDGSVALGQVDSSRESSATSSDQLPPSTDRTETLLPDSRHVDAAAGRNGVADGSLKTKMTNSASAANEGDQGFGASTSAGEGIAVQAEQDSTHLAPSRTDTTRTAVEHSSSTVPMSTSHADEGGAARLPGVKPALTAGSSTLLYYTGGLEGRPLEVFASPARELSNRLGLVPLGASVAVLAVAGDWIKVRSGAMLGWCRTSTQSGEALFSSDPLPPTAAVRKRWYKVTTLVGDAGLAVRVAPRHTAAVIGHIFAGQRVQARPVDGEWLELDLPGQTRAWIISRRGRNVYAVQDESHTDHTAHALLELVPRDPEAMGTSTKELATTQIFCSRSTSVAELLLDYCKRHGLTHQMFALYWREVPLLGYATLAELGIVSADVLEVGLRPEQDPPDAFTTVVVRHGAEHVVVKLLRSASISCVCDQYCVRQQAEGAETTFSFDGQPVLPYDTPASLGMRDMDELEAVFHDGTAGDPLQRRPGDNSSYPALGGRSDEANTTEVDDDEPDDGEQDSRASFFPRRTRAGDGNGAQSSESPFPSAEGQNTVRGPTCKSVALSRLHAWRPALTLSPAFGHKAGSGRGGRSASKGNSSFADSAETKDRISSSGAASSHAALVTPGRNLTTFSGAASKTNSGHKLTASSSLQSAHGPAAHVAQAPTERPKGQELAHLPSANKRGISFDNAATSHALLPASTGWTLGTLQPKVRLVKTAHAVGDTKRWFMNDGRHSDSGTPHMAADGLVQGTSQELSSGLTPAHGSDNSRAPLRPAIFSTDAADLLSSSMADVSAAHGAVSSSVADGSEEPDVVPGTLPEVEEFIPFQLMTLATSQHLLEPPARQLLILICHILERVSLNCSWRSLMWVFRHERLPHFLRVISRTEDEGLQESVTRMMMALCEHVATLSDARCCDAETVFVVAPHALESFVTMVRGLVDEVLVDPVAMAQLPYSLRLSFLLRLVVPRHGIASSLSVDFHPHPLVVSYRSMRWTCVSCHANFDTSDRATRFHCSQGCAFDLCSDCVPYANPEFANEVITWPSLLQLLRAVGAQSLHSASCQGRRLAVLALTMARWADPRRVLAATETWDALRACVFSSSSSVGLNLRGAVRSLLLGLLSHVRLAREATRRALELVSAAVSSSEKATGSAVVIDILDCLLQNGLTVLSADVSTVLALVDAVGSLAARHNDASNSHQQWNEGDSLILFRLQQLLGPALAAACSGNVGLRQPHHHRHFAAHPQRLSAAGASPVEQGDADASVSPPALALVASGHAGGRTGASDGQRLGDHGGQQVSQRDALGRVVNAVTEQGSQADVQLTDGEPAPRRAEGQRLSSHPVGSRSATARVATRAAAEDTDTADLGFYSGGNSGGDGSGSGSGGDGGSGSGSGGDGGSGGDDGSGREAVDGRANQPRFFGPRSNSGSGSDSRPGSGVPARAATRDDQSSSGAGAGLFEDSRSAADSFTSHDNEDGDAAESLNSLELGQHMRGGRVSSASLSLELDSTSSSLGAVSSASGQDHGLLFPPTPLDHHVLAREVAAHAIMTALYVLSGPNADNGVGEVSFDATQPLTDGDSFGHQHASSLKGATGLNTRKAATSGFATAPDGLPNALAEQAEDELGWPASATSQSPPLFDPRCHIATGRGRHLSPSRVLYAFVRQLVAVSDMTARAFVHAFMTLRFSRHAHRSQSPALAVVLYALRRPGAVVDFVQRFDGLHYLFALVVGGQHDDGGRLLVGNSAGAIQPSDSLASSRTASLLSLRLHDRIEYFSLSAARSGTDQVAVRLLQQILHTARHDAHLLGALAEDAELLRLFARLAQLAPRFHCLAEDVLSGLSLLRSDMAHEVAMRLLQPPFHASKAQALVRLAQEQPDAARRAWAPELAALLRSQRQHLESVSAYIHVLAETLSDSAVRRVVEKGPLWQELTADLLKWQVGSYRRLDAQVMQPGFVWSSRLLSLFEMAGESVQQGADQDQQAQNQNENGHSPNTSSDEDVEDGETRDLGSAAAQAMVNHGAGSVQSAAVANESAVAAKPGSEGGLSTGAESESTRFVSQKSTDRTPIPGQGPLLKHRFKFADRPLAVIPSHTGEVASSAASGSHVEVLSATLSPGCRIRLRTSMTLGSRLLSAGQEGTFVSMQAGIRWDDMPQDLNAMIDMNCLDVIPPPPALSVGDIVYVAKDVGLQTQRLGLGWSDVRSGGLAGKLATVQSVLSKGRAVRVTANGMGCVVAAAAVQPMPQGATRARLQDRTETCMAVWRLLDQLLAGEAAVSKGGMESRDRRAAAPPSGRDSNLVQQPMLHTHSGFGTANPSRNSLVEQEFQEKAQHSSEPLSAGGSLSSVYHTGSRSHESGLLSDHGSNTQGRDGKLISSNMAQPSVVSSHSSGLRVGFGTNFSSPLFASFTSSGNPSRMPTSDTVQMGSGNTRLDIILRAFAPARWGSSVTDVLGCTLGLAHAVLLLTSVRQALIDADHSFHAAAIHGLVNQSLSLDLHSSQTSSEARLLAIGWLHFWAQVSVDAALAEVARAHVTVSHVLSLAQQLHESRRLNPTDTALLRCMQQFTCALWSRHPDALRALGRHCQVERTPSDLLRSWWALDAAAVHIVLRIHASAPPPPQPHVPRSWLLGTLPDGAVILAVPPDTTTAQLAARLYGHWLPPSAYCCRVQSCGRQLYLDGEVVYEDSVVCLAGPDTQGQLEPMRLDAAFANYLWFTPVRAGGDPIIVHMSDLQAGVWRVASIAHAGRSTNTSNRTGDSGAAGYHHFPGSIKYGSLPLPASLGLGTLVSVLQEQQQDKLQQVARQQAAAPASRSAATDARFGGAHVKKEYLRRRWYRAWCNSGMVLELEAFVGGPAEPVSLALGGRTQLSLVLQEAYIKSALDQQHRAGRERTANHSPASATPSSSLSLASMPAPPERSKLSVTSEAAVSGGNPALEQAVSRHQVDALIGLVQSEVQLQLDQEAESHDAPARHWLAWLRELRRACLLPAVALRALRHPLLASRFWSFVCSVNDTEGLDHRMYDRPDAMLLVLNQVVLAALSEDHHSLHLRRRMVEGGWVAATVRRLQRVSRGQSAAGFAGEDVMLEGGGDGSSGWSRFLAAAAVGHLQSPSAPSPAEGTTSCEGRLHGAATLSSEADAVTLGTNGSDALGAVVWRLPGGSHPNTYHELCLQICTVADSNLLALGLVADVQPTGGLRNMVPGQAAGSHGLDYNSGLLAAGDGRPALRVLLRTMKEGDSLGFGMKDDLLYFVLNGVPIAGFHGLAPRSSWRAVVVGRGGWSFTTSRSGRDDPGTSPVFSSTAQEQISVETLLAHNLPCAPAAGRLVGVSDMPAPVPGAGVGGQQGYRETKQTAAVRKRANSSGKGHNAGAASDLSLLRREEADTDETMADGKAFQDWAHFDDKLAAAEEEEQSTWEATTAASSGASQSRSWRHLAENVGMAHSSEVWDAAEASRLQHQQRKEEVTGLCILQLLMQADRQGLWIQAAQQAVDAGLPQYLASRLNNDSFTEMSKHVDLYMQLLRTSRKLLDALEADYVADDNTIPSGDSKYEEHADRGERQRQQEPTQGSTQAATLATGSQQGIDPSPKDAQMPLTDSLPGSQAATSAGHVKTMVQKKTLLREVVGVLSPALSAQAERAQTYLQVSLNSNMGVAAATGNGRTVSSRRHLGDHDELKQSVAHGHTVGNGASHHQPASRGSSRNSGPSSATDSQLGRGSSSQGSGASDDSAVEVVQLAHGLTQAWKSVQQLMRQLERRSRRGKQPNAGTAAEQLGASATMTTVAGQPPASADEHFSAAWPDDGDASAATQALRRPVADSANVGSHGLGVEEQTGGKEDEKATEQQGYNGLHQGQPEARPGMGDADIETLAYKEHLQSWRLHFQTGFFREGHAYAQALGEAVPRSLTSAMSSELTDARSALPCTSAAAVFYAVADVQMNLLKVLVTGVQDTPYSGGCFIFDVYCPPEYPRVSPKVSLCTTGGGQVRFNPNLYQNGRVCLSLLGTWEGQGGEAWGASSSLLQVFTSIQSLIMTDAIYFNEPGYEHLRDTVKGQRLNAGYANIARYATVKFAMLDMLRHTPPSFDYVVRRHFYQRRQSIVVQCRQWVKEAGEEAAITALYGDLVAAHNPALAARFAAEPLAYKAALAEVVDELIAALASMESPVPPRDDADDSDDEEEDDEDEENDGDDGVEKEDEDGDDED